MSIVIPGDSIDTSNAKLGPGFYYSPLTQVAQPVKAGFLVTSQRGASTLAYLDCKGKRYVPALRDHVLGVVINKNADGYKVLLQDHSIPVRLGQYAFENATKRNRPNLQLGTLVYGRISLAEKDVEAEMECFDATTGKAGGFGELNGGYIVEVSLGYARFLLFEEGAELLSRIGEKVSFETAIGVNGKVWITAADNLTVLKIAELIKKCESLPLEQGLKLIGKAKLANSDNS